jgi:hypothetical protein
MSATIAFLTIGGSNIAISHECMLNQLSVTPKTDGDFGWYSGLTEKYIVEVQNFKPSEDVDVFPEPPLIIKSRMSEHVCTIDGGVWKKDGFYTSLDESTIFVFEFSGERSSLISYNLATCAQKAALDVSGLRWTIDKNRITLIAECRRGAPKHCRPKREVVLGNDCNLIK